MQTSSIFAALLVSAVSVLAGCKDASKTEGSPTPSASAPAASASPVATASAAPTVSAAPSASAAPAGGTALAPDATGALVLAWKVAASAAPNVAVSMVVGEETIAVGPLDGTNDDGSPVLSTCAMRSPTPNTSTLTCGGTPAYNYYSAKLAGGSLVVSLVKGVDNDPPGSDRVTEVLKRPTTATSLKTSGPASQALYGNCRPGFVQKTPDSPCLRQCLKGNECKGKDQCVFVNVKGTDGDHRVHACVPGK